ncbi:MAG: DUF4442 domain-containing protein [Pseudomonadales bacterium]|nr:DUF4442 domain-containing protein [Pseudomonadales bacterium]
MPEKNFLNRVVSKVNILPDGMRAQALTLTFGRAIRFAGTAGVRVEKLTDYEAVITLKNRKKAQNHIGSLHAAAIALAGESATGFLVGMSVPDSHVPVIKTMHVDYVKRCTGDIRVEAKLSVEQVQRILSEDKGEVTVPVTITDEKGIEPVKCEYIWAWTSKVRKEKTS